MGRLGGVKRRNVIIGLAVLLVFGLGLAFLVSLAPVIQWDRWDNIRVTGRIVDPETDQPLAGVRIMTLKMALHADNEGLLRQRQVLAQQQLDMIAEEAERGHDTSGHCPGPNGLTTSDDEGQFTFCVRVGYGGTDWGWFFSSKPHEPPPFHGVRALLLQWQDGRQAVVDTSGRKWTVVGRRDLHAKLDMGTVRVAAP